MSCFVNSSALFVGCRIESNVAERGGGIHCWDTEELAPSFLGCTIRGNSGRRGGGVYSTSASPSYFNCLVTGNSAQELGGAMYFEGSGDPVVVHGTISANRTRTLNGGGFHCAGDLVRPLVVNTILWGNNPASVCGELLAVTQEDPLFETLGTFSFVRFTTVEIAGRPRLIPNFIVEEGDYRLQATSPARDAGVAEIPGQQLPPRDIAGEERVCGPLPDAGAFEYPSGECAGDPNFKRADVNADETVNLSDSIRLLDILFAGAEGSGCLGATDSNDDGRVNLSDVIAILEHLFQGAPALPDPFFQCGPDPTSDDLGCTEYLPCS